MWTWAWPRGLPSLMHPGPMTLPSCVHRGYGGGVWSWCGIPAPRRSWPFINESASCSRFLKKNAALWRMGWWGVAEKLFGSPPDREHFWAVVQISGRTFFIMRASLLSCFASQLENVLQFCKSPTNVSLDKKIHRLDLFSPSTRRRRCLCRAPGGGGWVLPWWAAEAALSCTFETHPPGPPPHPPWGGWVKVVPAREVSCRARPWRYRARPRAGRFSL